MRDYGAIEFMMVTNPLAIRDVVFSPMNQVTAQLNYLFPLTFK